jgi:hypothetical protein
VTLINLRLYTGYLGIVSSLVLLILAAFAVIPRGRAPVPGVAGSAQRRRANSISSAMRLRWYTLRKPSSSARLSTATERFFVAS